ncbi:hypothetical protein M8J76_006061 [Diaphorina citri]|nr:hypothetical protein M8J76_006061 [Diaphorina citri]KAI5754924.1 hypothetical protein M8J77_012666 [Diaphorina citri]
MYIRNVSEPQDKVEKSDRENDFYSVISVCPCAAETQCNAGHTVCQTVCVSGRHLSNLLNHQAASSCCLASCERGLMTIVILRLGDLNSKSTRVASNIT